MSKCHQRAADTIVQGAIQNGGLYVKLGQGLCAFNHLLPPEYINTLRVLEDQALKRGYKEVSMRGWRGGGQRFSRWPKLWQASPPFLQCMVGNCKKPIPFACGMMTSHRADGVLPGPLILLLTFFRVTFPGPAVIPAHTIPNAHPVLLGGGWG